MVQSRKRANKTLVGDDSARNPTEGVAGIWYREQYKPGTAGLGPASRFEVEE